MAYNISANHGISNISDFLNADYSTYFGSTRTQQEEIFSFFANYLTPFVAVGLYLVLSKPLLNLFVSTFKISPKGSVQVLTIAHSFILAAYSGWTFINMWRIGIPKVSANGLYGSFCDADGIKWNSYDFSFWVFHFYISKYYEFIDTWIVLLKGRDPIFLQTYHHAGIVLIMWSFVVTHNTLPGFITTIFNSFIHTLMYTYYVFAAFGYQSKLKNYLTQAQLVQFVVGLSLTVPGFFISGCMNPAQKLSLVAIHLYTYYLIYLFYLFYKETYLSKKNKKLDATATATTTRKNE